MRHPLCAAALVLALSMVPGDVDAQSRQPWSLQLSGEWVIPAKSYGDILQRGSSLGWEGQIRRTIGRFSVGAGFQQSIVFHSDAANLTGTLDVGFLEPRVVLAVIGEHLALYGAARLGYGALLIRETPRITQHSVTYGGGAGLLVALAPRLTLDAGGQYFLADFGGNQGTAGYGLARLGLAIGLF